MEAVSERKPRKRRAIELRVRMMVSVPADWDDDAITFFYNESSHCLGNELAVLAEQYDKDNENSVCNLCCRASAVLLPENTVISGLSERELGIEAN